MDFHGDVGHIFLSPGVILWFADIIWRLFDSRWTNGLFWWRNSWILWIPFGLSKHKKNLPVLRGEWGILWLLWKGSILEISKAVDSLLDWFVFGFDWLFWLRFWTATGMKRVNMKIISVHQPFGWQTCECPKSKRNEKFSNFSLQKVKMNLLHFVHISFTGYNFPNIREFPISFTDNQFFWNHTFCG